jgi:signal transduction histidine kinase
MITDMLDLDRIESGKMALQQEQVDLNALITDVVDRMRPTVPDHTFHLQLDNALLPIVGDRDKLIQVLTNLLSNAVKYSKEEGYRHNATGYLVKPFSPSDLREKIDAFTRYIQ